MSTKAMRKSTDSAFKQGVILGFAAPLLFFGSLPRYEVKHVDNVSQAWRNVGNTLRASIKREEVRLRDRNA